MLFRRRPHRFASANQRRPLSVQRLENRQMMAGDGLSGPEPTGLDRPLGATHLDTAEFMLGRIVVTPVFLESNGTRDVQSQNWDAAEIRSVLDNIEIGMQWWNRTLQNVQSNQTLDFVFDETYAVNPVPTIYEPIDRSSDDYSLYVREFLNAAGVTGAITTDEGMFAFNDRQRAAHQADWAFTIFVVDSSDDANGFFPSSGSFQGAFALAGGLYVVLPSTRPIRTITHEVGHIFWAMDEYQGGGSFADHRGVYDTQNQNAWNNPTPGFVQADSIMASDAAYFNAFNNNTSSPVTLAQIGWRDSDFDGIFDIVDAPLELTGSGFFDPLTSQIRFNGRANAVPVQNRNPEGPQSDITINRIRRVEISFDEGPWELVASPNRYVSDLNLNIDAPARFTTFAIRAVDDRIGVVSNLIRGTSATPAALATTLTAFAYLDENDDGSRGATESLLSGVSVGLFSGSGVPLPSGSFTVGDVPRQTDIENTAGMSFSGAGNGYGPDVQARVDASVNMTLLHVYEETFNFWTSRLSDRSQLEVTFDQPTRRVEVDVVGLRAVAYARVEAFDVNGALITRTTTDLRNDANGQLSLGESQTLVVNDPSGRIASIRVGGHASTWVGVSGVRHGGDSVLPTGDAGVVDFGGVPDGEYQLTAIANEVIHQFTPQSVTIVGGQLVGGLATLAATRIDSLRYRTSNPEDVNGDNQVTALDALLVINDLNRLGSRSLTFAENSGPMIDVNNDGRVTAVDALRVINRLNTEDGNRSGGEPTSIQIASASRVGGEPEIPHDTVMTQWVAAPDPPSSGSVESKWVASADEVQSTKAADYVRV